jgi:hypothetical protein
MEPRGSQERHHLAKDPFAKTWVQRVRGGDIHFAPKHFAKLQAEVGKVQQGPPRLELDEEVDIALWVSVTSSNGTEHTGVDHPVETEGGLDLRAEGIERGRHTNQSTAREQRENGPAASGLTSAPYIPA